MKKLACFALLGILLISALSFSFTFAQENESEDSDEESDDINETENEQNEAEGEEDEEDEEEENEEEDEIDEETEEETEVIDINYGAKIRLLQLERHIKKRILWANAVVEVIEEKNKSAGELKEIVSELEALLDELQALPENQTKQEAVKSFVNIKLDAKELIKEFREKAKNLLTEKDRNALRMKFSEIDKSELKEITEKMEELKRLMRKEIVKNILELMEIEDEELLQKIEAGEITVGEIKKKLKEHYNSMTDEQKQAFKSKLKEIHKKRKLLRINMLIKAHAAKLEEKSERIMKRAEWLRDKGFENASERMAEKSDALKTRSEELKVALDISKRNFINKIKDRSLR